MAEYFPVPMDLDSSPEKRQKISAAAWHHLVPRVFSVSELASLSASDLVSLNTSQLEFVAREHEDPAMKDEAYGLLLDEGVGLCDAGVGLG